MEKNELRFKLNPQLFGEKKKPGDDIDPDKELENIPAKNVDADTDEDIDEDDIYDDDDEEEEEEEDDFDAEDGDDEDDDSDDSDDKSKETKEDDESKDQDKDSSKETDDKSTSTTKKPAQNRDLNHEQKVLREQREAEEKARKENFDKGFIAALGGVNPYTGEKIENDDDIHEAKVMIEAKKRGLDPIQDYSKVDKAMRKEEREALEKAEADKVTAAEARKKDFEEFSKAYPDVDVADLFNTQDFSEFAADLVGNIPLTKVYDLYLKTQEKTAKAVEDSDDMKKARRQSTPGNLSSGGSSNGDFYTKEQLDKMSPEEIKQNWKKVERSYEHLTHLGKK